jgi:hypothetical protein
MRLAQDLMSAYARPNLNLSSTVRLFGPISCSENPPELDMVQDIIQALFPGTQILDFRTFEGHVHPVYLLRLSSGLEVVLKAGPRQLTALLRQERHTLETEAEVLALLGSNGSEKEPWIPRLLKFDILKFCPCTPFLLKHSLRGIPLGEIESSLTSGDRKDIDRQLGIAVKAIGEHTSTRFGYVRNVSLGGGKPSWKQAFLGFIESLLRDAEDMFISLPYADIRQYISRLTPVLDDVIVARLVVVEISKKSHVLIDPVTKQVSGFADFSSAVWGDVLMADVFENPSSAFFGGYGSNLANDESERIRLLLFV